MLPSQQHTASDHKWTHMYLHIQFTHVTQYRALYICNMYIRSVAPGTGKSLLKLFNFGAFILRNFSSVNAFVVIPADSQVFTQSM